MALAKSGLNAMDKDRHVFTLTLELISDLHLGDGETRDGPTPEGRSQPVQIATLARDHRDLPWLPGTSIKGALRAISDDEDVFGTFEKGGKLILWGGELDEQSLPKKEVCKLPHYDQTKGRYSGAHVSIDPKSGAADDGKLFFRDYVPRGATFIVRCCWQGSFDDLETQLLPILNRAAGRWGFALGKASRAGFGRVRIINAGIAVTSKYLTLEEDVPGVHTEPVITLPLTPETGADTTTLTLHCEGPFIIVDPTRAREGNAESERMRSFQRDASAAELLGTSLIGALRRRAGWLQQLKMQLGPDDRGAKFGGDATKLTPVQNLFGINGWAKRIRIVALKHESTGSPVHLYPGVQLDDFTQGTMPGALFMFEAPGDVRFKVTLSVEPDSTLWPHLLADISTNGLKIGHKTGSGFGWFEVSETPATQEATDD